MVLYARLTHENIETQGLKWKTSIFLPGLSSASRPGREMAAAPARTGRAKPRGSPAAVREREERVRRLTPYLNRWENGAERPATEPKNAEASAYECGSVKGRWRPRPWGFRRAEGGEPRRTTLEPRGAVERWVQLQPSSR